jgi:hypothetical protein
MLFALSVLAGVHPALAVKRIAFATSASGTGNLHSWPEADGAFGLEAGDAICRFLAGEAGLDNAGSFRVWLSTASTDAYCHVQGLTGEKAAGCSGPAAPAGPWFLQTQGSNFTPALAQLTGNGAVIFRGVLQDENGTFLDPPTASTYWTGTTATGEASDATCSSWVVAASDVDGTIGDARASAVKWTDWIDTGCDSERRLLCLEPGASDPTTKTVWTPSALAFVTSAWGSGKLSTWEAAGGESGMAAGDAICRNLATAAHLPAPDSFLAFLSDSGVDAIDRLTLTNVRYRRVDHYQIADNRGDLLDGTNDNSLHVDEWGRYVTNGLTAFTGTETDGTYAGTSCLEWDSTSQPGNVTAGGVSNMRSGVWTAGIGTSCSISNRLYCLSNTVTIFWDGFDLTAGTGRWSAASP